MTAMHSYACTGLVPQDPMILVAESSAHLAHLAHHPWFHGKLSKEQAEWTLSTAGNNKFLVREGSKGHRLVLSMKIKGWISHHAISYSSGRYSLDGRRENFSTIPEMITYYHKFPIWKKELLGSVCDRKQTAESECANC